MLLSWLAPRYDWDDGGVHSPQVGAVFTRKLSSNKMCADSYSPARPLGFSLDLPGGEGAACPARAISSSLLTV